MTLSLIHIYGDLTIQLATDIGRAAGMVVEETAGPRPTFIVGKDTRVSSDMLEAALAAGLCSVGADVVLLGVVPTPAVAYLVTRYGADAGIMLSASHNPYEYNVIKTVSYTHLPANLSGYRDGRCVRGHWRGCACAGVDRGRQ